MRVPWTPIWSKGVLDDDSGVCCSKEVKTTAKILSFQRETHENTNP